MTTLIERSVSQLQQVINNIYLGKGEREQIIIIADVSWQDYNTLLNLLGDNASFLCKYSRETLQIMSPSYRHEFYKENFGILLEAYFQEKGIRF